MVGSLRRVPVWAWLAAIVTCSFLLRAWLARAMVGPFIMVDELIYSELARSFAAGDGFQVRDVPAGGFSLVYPILISPAYWLFDSLTDAYAAVKTLNALYMSLAAVPAYLLARRVLAPGLSLVAALLAVALPSFVYTGTVMTENVFYPLFLVASLLLVLVLEQPTTARQLGLLAAVGLLFATRVQAVAFLPAIVVAPILAAWLGRQPVWPALRRLRLLYGVVVVGGLLLVVAQVARGRSLTDLLGAYSVVRDRSYDPETVARYFLYHLAELDLYLGVLPFAAFVLLVVLARRLEPTLAPFLAAGVTLTVSVLLVVGAFASVFAIRIQERNTFVVAPFFLIALLVWVDRGLPRPRWVALPIAVGAALLPLTIPFEQFINDSAFSDTLMLLPIWDAYGSLLFDSVDATVLAGGLVAAALFLLVPRRWAAVLPAATAPLLRGDLLQRLGGRVRLPVCTSLGRCGLPGNPRRAARLDRPCPSGRSTRSLRLDGCHGPVRGQPERVLQPRGRCRSTSSAAGRRATWRRRRSSWTKRPARSARSTAIASTSRTS